MIRAIQRDPQQEELTDEEIYLKRLEGGLFSLQLVRFGLLHILSHQLEGTARYAGFLLAPAEGFNLQPRFFGPSGKKKPPFLLLFLLVLGHF